MFFDFSHPSFRSLLYINLKVSDFCCFLSLRFISAYHHPIFLFFISLPVLLPQITPSPSFFSFTPFTSLFFCITPTTPPLSLPPSPTGVSCLLRHVSQSPDVFAGCCWKIGHVGREGASVMRRWEESKWKENGEWERESMKGGKKGEVRGTLENQRRAREDTVR